MSIGDFNSKPHPFYSDGECVNLFSTKSKKMLKSQNLPEFFMESKKREIEIKLEITIRV
jgi:hypothetical protein